MNDPQQTTETFFNHDPLRVMFVHTSLTMGGEEVLLVEIIQRMDRSRFAPELCCLKERGRWPNCWPMMSPYSTSCRPTNSICVSGTG